MPHVRQITPSLRVLECDVKGDVVVVHGLPYGRPSLPHLLHRLACAGRIEVIVDLDDIESVLVKDPWDASLHRLRCLISQEARLRQLADWLCADASAEQDAEVTPPRLRSAA